MIGTRFAHGGWYRPSFGTHWSQIRGRESEINVDRVLGKLKDEHLIDDYRYTGNNTPEDHQGIDFVVTKDGDDIPLQVKSSNRGLGKHYKKYGEEIPAVNGQSSGLGAALRNLFSSYHT